MKLITNLAWGNVDLNDGSNYKDVILTPSAASSWDWTQDGTSHNPGITLTAVNNIANCEIIILSMGMENKLRTCNEVINYLNENGKQYFQVPSQEAKVLYNKYAQEGKNVGLLLHSTC